MASGAGKSNLIMRAEVGLKMIAIATNHFENNIRIRKGFYEILVSKKKNTQIRASDLCHRLQIVKNGGAKRVGWFISNT